MGRRGSWLRNLIGAAGTAVIVPVGLLVAVAVAAGIGGGGLGGLGQLVGGPTLPGQDPVVVALGGGNGTDPSQLPAVPTERPSSRRDGAVRPSETGARGTGDGGGGTSDPAGDRPRDATGTTGPGPASQPPPDPFSTPGASPAPPAPPDGGPAAPSPTPTPGPDPLGDLVRGVGEVVDDIVRPLPVAGPPVADAVGTVIDLVAPPRTVVPPAAGATPAP